MSKCHSHSIIFNYLRSLSHRVSYLGRSSRQYSEGEEEIGDIYANAKAICEVSSI